jgi:YHS domain-containing protein
MRINCEICGSSIHAAHATGRVHLPERTCYFCCEACRRTFHEHPDLYPDGCRLHLTAAVAASLPVG